MFNLPLGRARAGRHLVVLSGKTLPLGWFKVSNITLMLELGSRCQYVTLRSQVKPGLFLDKARGRAEQAAECLPVLRVGILGPQDSSQPEQSGKMTWEFTCAPKHEALNSQSSQIIKTTLGSFSILQTITLLLSSGNCLLYTISTFGGNASSPDQLL